MSGSEDDFASADEGERSEPDLIESTGIGTKATTGIKDASPLSDSTTKKLGNKDAKDKSPAIRGKGEPASVTGNKGNMETETHKKLSTGKGAKPKQKKGSSQKKAAHTTGTSKEAASSSGSMHTVEKESLEVKGEVTTTVSENPEVKEIDRTEPTQLISKCPESVNEEKQTIDSSAAMPKPRSTPERCVQDNDNVDKSDSIVSSEAEAAAMAKSPSSQDIPRSKPDHTHQQEEVLENLADAVKESQTKSTWGWGWGSSLLDVASTSVSTFTSQVGEGFSTVMETVESTMNLPSPEDMAASRGDIIPGLDLDSVKEPQANGKDPVADDELPETSTHDQHTESSPAGDTATTEERSRNPSGGNWFSSWGMSNITNVVQHTVTGGLDVLETLGKKTFDVIKDHDPGLKKTKGLLFERGDKSNLSQMLRDAKEQSDIRTQHEHETEEARKAHFGSLFDDFQGLAHVEALEILSNQSEKCLSALLNSLQPETIAEIKPRLLEIKGHFESVEEDDGEVEEQDFAKLVADILVDLNVGTTPDKLIQAQKQAQQSVESFKEGLESEDKPCPKDIHRVAISSLAELTAKSMEQFHKVGELILLHCTQQTDFVASSGHLAGLTKVLCSEVGIMSASFTQCLNKSADGEESSSVNPLVTNVYLEAANSSSYIQDGFQLLLPVLQQATIENSQGES